MTAATLTKPPSDMPVWRPWLVCFGAALFFFFGYMQVNVFNALNPYLYYAFHLTSPTQLGALSSLYFYSIVASLIPAGLILDRFSTRWTILASLSVFIIVTALFGASQVFWEAGLCRLILGVAGSFCLLSNVRLASRWFPPQRMALVIGLAVTLAMLGAMVAQTPLTLLVDHLGWRDAVYVDALMGVVLFIFIAAVVRDYPPNYSHEQHTEHTQLGIGKSFLLAMRNRQNWLGGAYTSLMNIPLFLFGAVWGSMYIEQVFHYSRTQASIVNVWLFLGMIVGSPIMGWFSDRVARRKWPMVVSAIIAVAIGLVFLSASELSLWSLCFLFFVLGFIMAAQVIGYPLIAESNPLPLVGAGSGLGSVLIMSGGILMPLFPWLLQIHSGQHTVEHLHAFSVADYHFALLIVPASFLLALLAALCIKETYCESYATRTELHKQSD